MTPAFCRVKHDPENGTYGDCLRAAVATLLDKNTDDVPHFNHDGSDANTANGRLREYLATLGLAPWWSHFDPNEPLSEVLAFAADNNRDCYYLLFGITSSGEAHVIVCRNNEVAHDPAWYRSPIVRAGDHGAWTTMVLVKQ